MPGYLIPGDLENIATHLGKTPTEILDKFAASPGAVVARMENGKVIVGRIPTIVPIQQADGRCVFLQPDGLCSVHPVAPFGCAVVDSHMSQHEGNERSSRGLHTILQSETYPDIWNTLHEAGRITLGPEAKRKVSEATLKNLSDAATKLLQQQNETPS